MNTKQKKALYESIMKSVAKTVKKQLNESGEVELGFDENSEIYITVYFSSNDPENCYSNNTADINHPSVVNIIKNLMQDYIYTTDETNIDVKGHQSSLEIIITSFGLAYINAADDYFQEINDKFEHVFCEAFIEGAYKQYKTN